MKNYEFVVTNELQTDAKDEDEFLTIFNDKLATLFLLYERINLGGCNETEFAV